MNRNLKLLGYYNYTVILTYIGMLTGFAGILYAFEERPMAAVLCLMIAGFCDMFDGAVASTMQRTEQEKCFGIQIDSFSDLICFGVLPASITCTLNGHSTAAKIIGGLYVLAALVRLAYFNVDEQERQKVSAGSREWYQGLPVTMSAMFLPFVFELKHLTAVVPYTALSLLLIVMGACFLLPISIKKPKKIGKILMIVIGMVELFLLVSIFGGL